MKTFRVILYAEYIVDANDFDEAIIKAKNEADVYDLDCGYSDVEEVINKE